MILGTILLIAVLGYALTLQFMNIIYKRSYKILSQEYKKIADSGAWSKERVGELTDAHRKELVTIELKHNRLIKDIELDNESKHAKIEYLSAQVKDFMGMEDLVEKYNIKQMLDECHIIMKESKSTCIHVAGYLRSLPSMGAGFKTYASEIKSIADRVTDYHKKHNPVKYNLDTLDLTFNCVDVDGIEITKIFKDDNICIKREHKEGEHLHKIHFTRCIHCSNSFTDSGEGEKELEIPVGSEFDVNCPQCSKPQHVLTEIINGIEDGNTGEK